MKVETPEQMRDRLAHKTRLAEKNPELYELCKGFWKWMKDGHDGKPTSA